MFAKFLKSARNGGKWLWEYHPEIAIAAVAALASFPPALYFFVYKQWYLGGPVSYYKTKYTVWRPDDPHVKFMRLPSEYPPPYLTVRTNWDLVNGEKEY